MHEFVITALSIHLPSVLRWAGAIAKRLRGHNISLIGKSSGSEGTDALTLADLSLQEMIVAALRDCDPIFRHCRIDAEEATGDLQRFPAEAELTIGLDPIDGTRRYRDHLGSGYSVMLHLRSRNTVLYSLVYQPERSLEAPDGYWIEAKGESIRCGPDDHSRPAADVVNSLPPIDLNQSVDSNELYMNGFMQSDDEVIQRINRTGLSGVRTSQFEETPYELIATGRLCGALIHSPNVYDFPVTMHLCRIRGGDAVWVKNGESVHFGETWLDDRSNMIRLPGVVAASSNLDVLEKLVTLAREWNSERYRSGMSLIP